MLRLAASSDEATVQQGYLQLVSGAITETSRTLAERRRALATELAAARTANQDGAAVGRGQAERQCVACRQPMRGSPREVTLPGGNKASIGLICCFGPAEAELRAKGIDDSRPADFEKALGYLFSKRVVVPCACCTKAVRQPVEGRAVELQFCANCTTLVLPALLDVSYSTVQTLENPRAAGYMAEVLTRVRSENPAIGGGGGLGAQCFACGGFEGGARGLDIRYDEKGEEAKGLTPVCIGCRDWIAARMRAVIT